MDFLDLLGVSYHASVVFFLGTVFLFKSILAYCEMHEQQRKIKQNHQVQFIWKCYEQFAIILILILLIHIWVLIGLKLTSGPAELGVQGAQFRTPFLTNLQFYDM